VSATTTGGGYLIPQGFSGQLEEALKWYGGMYQAAELVPTETGNPLPWPTVNDTAQVGELLGINTAAAAQDFAFGQVVIGAFKYSSKLVLVPIELLQDSFFDLNTFLARKLGERLGRITNTHFTVGTGGGAQPNGIVPLLLPARSGWSARLPR
jgi:HK97 family phage major capsid protein